MMGSGRITTLYLTEVDLQAIRLLQEKWRCRSASEVVRIAVRREAGLTDAELSAGVRRGLSSTPNVFEISAKDAKDSGIEVITDVEPRNLRPVGPGINQRKTIFENKDGEK